MEGTPSMHLTTLCTFHNPLKVATILVTAVD